MASDRMWPGAGAPFVDFIATLLTAGAHLERPLWSGPIERLSDRTQSETGFDRRPARFQRLLFAACIGSLTLT
jgi:hypothetical protein